MVVPMPNDDSASRVAMVCGVGPGLGTALCDAFVAKGLVVAALSRGSLPECQARADVTAYPCDITDPAQVDRTVATIEAELGGIDVVVHNAAAFSSAPFVETTLADFDRALAVTARGGFLVAQRVLPHMLDRGRGTLLFSGATASTRGSANFAALATSKFALRGLAQSLAREFGSRGIHVAHIVIDGVIWCDWTRRRFDIEQARSLDAAALANLYVDLYSQSETVWTHELDVRPASERF